jgi:hypothetical protein
MATDELDNLLARMPEIAKAVNAFTSDAVQQVAFNALVGAFGGTQPPETQHNEVDPSTGKVGGSAPRGRSKRGLAGGTGAAEDSSGKPPRKRASAKPPAMVGDLNLRPPDKQAFRDFVTEKAPTTSNDRNVVTVYYLKEVLGLSKVSADHIFTAFREMSTKWKLPNNLRNSLQVTKSQVGWIDTRDMDDITLAAAGTNVVEHDLPRATKVK